MIRFSNVVFVFVYVITVLEGSNGDETQDPNMSKHEYGYETDITFVGGLPFPKIVQKDRELSDQPIQIGAVSRTSKQVIDSEPNTNSNQMSNVMNEHTDGNGMTNFKYSSVMNKTAYNQESARNINNVLPQKVNKRSKQMSVNGCVGGRCNNITNYVVIRGKTHDDKDSDTFQKMNNEIDIIFRVPEVKQATGKVPIPDSYDRFVQKIPEGLTNKNPISQNISTPDVFEIYNQTKAFVRLKNKPTQKIINLDHVQLINATNDTRNSKDGYETTHNNSLLRQIVLRPFWRDIGKFQSKDVNSNQSNEIINTKREHRKNEVYTGESVKTGNVLYGQIRVINKAPINNPDSNHLKDKLYSDLLSSSWYNYLDPFLRKVVSILNSAQGNYKVTDRPGSLTTNRTHKYIKKVHSNVTEDSQIHVSIVSSMFTVESNKSARGSNTFEQPVIKKNSYIVHGIVGGMPKRPLPYSHLRNMMVGLGATKKLPHYPHIYRHYNRFGSPPRPANVFRTRLITDKLGRPVGRAYSRMTINRDRVVSANRRNQTQIGRRFRMNPMFSHYPGYWNRMRNLWLNQRQGNRKHENSKKIVFPNFAVVHNNAGKTLSRQRRVASNATKEPNKDAGNVTIANAKDSAKSKSNKSQPTVGEVQPAAPPANMTVAGVPRTWHGSILTLSTILCIAAGVILCCSGLAALVTCLCLWKFPGLGIGMNRKPGLSSASEERMKLIGPVSSCYQARLHGIDTQPTITMQDLAQKVQAVRVRTTDHTGDCCPNLYQCQREPPYVIRADQISNPDREFAHQQEQLDRSQLDSNQLARNQPDHTNGDKYETFSDYSALSRMVTHRAPRTNTPAYGGGGGGYTGPAGQGIGQVGIGQDRPVSAQSPSGQMTMHDTVNLR